jgi:hypothetical protein
MIVTKLTSRFFCAMPLLVFSTQSFAAPVRPGIIQTGSTVLTLESADETELAAVLRTARVSAKKFEILNRLQRIDIVEADASNRPTFLTTPDGIWLRVIYDPDGHPISLRMRNAVGRSALLRFIQPTFDDHNQKIKQNLTGSTMPTIRYSSTRTKTLKNLEVTSAVWHGAVLSI